MKCIEYTIQNTESKLILKFQNIHIDTKQDTKRKRKQTKANIYLFVQMIC